MHVLDALGGRAMQNQHGSVEGGDPASVIATLFKAAQEQGAVSYTYTLLRVGGIGGHPDPFLTLGDTLPSDWELLSSRQKWDAYCRIAILEEPVALIANLLNAATKAAYQPFPFESLIKATPTGFQRPDARARVETLIARAETPLGGIVANALRRCYAVLLNGVCNDRDPTGGDHTDDYPGLFWSALYQQYWKARKAYGNTSQYVKWPQFEVFEILCDNELGLYGFRVYFSNGGYAEWVRRKEYARGLNLVLQDGLNFQVGMLNGLRREWRVGARRLHEVGLPGRYNPLGEWRPIVYEGPTDWIDGEIADLSDDPDIRGALFYIYTTCHHVVEFVVRSDVNLPFDNAFEFGSVRYPVHLFKCEPQDDWDPNIRIYDGWVMLHAAEPSEIEQALRAVAVAIGRLAFVFAGEITWKVKYAASFRGSTPTLAQPAEADVLLLDNLMTDLPYIVDFAIDWHNRGRASRNPFSAFLCYFVAIEVIANAAYQKSSGLGLNPSRATKSALRNARHQCIQEHYGRLFHANPEEFVRAAYFQCLTPLNARRREICELVFGESHPAIDALFKTQAARPSLTKIRDSLAHGTIALLLRDHEQLVRQRLPEMARITNEFLMRVALKLKPEDQCPAWSRRASATMVMSDPRSVKVVSHLPVLGDNNWAIQPRWCE